MRKRRRLLLQGCPRWEESPGAVPQRCHAVGGEPPPPDVGQALPRDSVYPASSVSGGFPCWLRSKRRQAMTISRNWVTAWTCSLFRSLVACSLVMPRSIMVGHKRRLRKRLKLLLQGCPRWEDSPAAVLQCYHAVSGAGPHQRTLAAMSPLAGPVKMPGCRLGYAHKPQNQCTNHILSLLYIQCTD